MRTGPRRPLRTAGDGHAAASALCRRLAAARRGWRNLPRAKGSPGNGQVSARQLIKTIVINHISSVSWRKSLIFAATQCRPPYGDTGILTP